MEWSFSSNEKKAYAHILRLDSGPSLCGGLERLAAYVELQRGLG